MRLDPMNKPRTIIAALILAALVCLFVFNVHANYFLCDDAFISFRYADHLAQREGLVWNPGERVEGYTNFLWVLFMAAGIRVGIEPELYSNVLGIASGVCLLTVLLIFCLRSAPKDYPLLWIAPLALAASRSFTAWCTGGLETMFFALLIFAGYLLYLRERERRSSRPLDSSLLFAAATLVRPEGALFMAVAGAFFLGEMLSRRRALLSGLVWLAPYIAVVGSHTIWRFAYYGYWLPNTFYAKVSGALWERGFEYLSQFALEYHLLWFLPLAILALVIRPRFVTVLFTAVSVSYILYVAYIGGDRLEFRFLVIIFPYLYWLLAQGLLRIASRNKAVAWGIGAALIVTTGFVSQRAQERSQLHGVANLPVITSYASQRVSEGKFLRELIEEGLLSSDLVICVGGAGAVPYYTGWPTVDRRGLNDVTIARMPLEQRGLVAHEHDAPHEYLQRRKVAIFDVLNRLIYPAADVPHLPETMMHDGRAIPLRTVKAGDRYLVFATFLSEGEFRAAFGRLDSVP
jgi:hypothetical protein